jgi:hypothetical protein
MDSNHRPLPCQGSALDPLSYGPTSKAMASSILRGRGNSGNVRSAGHWVVYQNEGHVFYRPADARDYTLRMLRWFDRWFAGRK